MELSVVALSQDAPIHRQELALPPTIKLDQVSVVALSQDAPIDRQELALPPTIKLDQVKGFSLFMMKAVINGRGSEVIDLLKTSLF